MAANTDPIYSRTPDIQVVGSVYPGTAANTATDGTGACAVIFQADATEGGFVQKVILKAIASPIATCVRIYYCTVTGAFTPGTTNTAANTSLIAELSLPAFTASNTSASPQYEIALNLPMPAGTRLLIAYGTATGSNTGYATTVVGGKY
jgi:hypothetical protein